MIEPAHSIPGTTVPTISEKPVAHLTGQYAEAHNFDFRRLWHSLVERIWIVAICVLAGLFLALGYLARTPKFYQGHTVLEVEFQEPSFVPTADYTTRTRSVFLASQGTASRRSSRSRVHPQLNRAPRVVERGRIALSVGRRRAIEGKPPKK